VDRQFKVVLDLAEGSLKAEQQSVHAQPATVDF
jgi:hypothetical protein